MPLRRRRSSTVCRFRSGRSRRTRVPWRAAERRRGRGSRRAAGRAAGPTIRRPPRHASTARSTSAAVPRATRRRRGRRSGSVFRTSRRSPTRPPRRLSSGGFVGDTFVGDSVIRATQMLCASCARNRAASRPWCASTSALLPQAGTSVRPMDRTRRADASARERRADHDALPERHVVIVERDDGREAGQRLGDPRRRRCDSARADRSPPR